MCHRFLWVLFSKKFLIKLFSKINFLFGTLGIINWGFDYYYDPAAFGGSEFAGFDICDAGIATSSKLQLIASTATFWCWNSFRWTSPFWFCKSVEAFAIWLRSPLKTMIIIFGSFLVSFFGKIIAIF